jgi:thymidylate synthase
MIKNIINLLSKIFRRKSLHKDSFDVNIKSQDKLKEIFGVDKDMKYGDFSAQTKEKRDQLKKLLETISKDPDRL